MNKEINLNDIVNYFGKLHDENWKYKQALLDIKEYIEKDKASWEISTFSQREDTTRVVFTKEAQDILDIVNKALGVDKE